ncbi:hypothetical protein HETIRDRAFT_149129 [Heterobasidion irregulare TC 32-1]|uniref:Uncharacterized protein n=1 Tax=Heterobasidion irregulare (strain TC 32-1) TaxID=747525 RepID=W4K9K0_HETIT|nr:uncharacterized protein HETIRDRAFT_149129 [Heterobasidion irregulare TC 32-1]ETW82458.1 hypothetical protein HETIRDRAFT_149129 [Heterobasidion irregulare TC 32-1]
MDKVHRGRHPWLLRVHYALPALVRRRCPCHRLFPRVTRAGPEALDRHHVVLYAPARPGVCLGQDLVWKYYKCTYMPASYHIAQEIQQYNIPDYRPRQEQFQKAIKKMRAVQRMRRNRGFAFSQTENPGRKDQSRLIHVYDTSKSDACPSEYLFRQFLLHFLDDAWTDVL